MFSVTKAKFNAALQMPLNQMHGRSEEQWPSGRQCFWSTDPTIRGHRLFSQTPEALCWAGKNKYNLLVRLLMQIISHCKIMAASTLSAALKRRVTLVSHFHLPIWNSPTQSLFFCSAKRLTSLSCPAQWLYCSFSCCNTWCETSVLDTAQLSKLWVRTYIFPGSFPLQSMWWEAHLLCSVSKLNHHGGSHADKRLCGRKCHKHQIAAVGIILTQHSQGEQNLIFCIQVIWFWSAAGVYLIQQDTWEHTKTLYLGTISCGCFSVKRNKVFHRSR